MKGGKDEGGGGGNIDKDVVGMHGRWDGHRR